MVTNETSFRAQSVKQKHFYWFVGILTVIVVILGIIVWQTHVLNKNNNEQTSRWIMFGIECGILIIGIIYPIVTHIITIRKDTSNIYQYVLLLYLLMLTALLVLVGTLLQTIRDCNTDDNGYCMIKTNNNNLNSFIKKYRGSTYYPHISDSNDEECLLTEWGLSHFLSCMVIGFLVPRQWLLLFLATVFWEIGEYYIADCHDILDLVWNSLGIVTGVGIRYLSKIP